MWTVLARFRDSLDQSLSLLSDHRALAVAAVALVGVAAWLLWKRFFAKKKPKHTTNVLQERATELARESARLIATALEERSSSSFLQAYFNAVQAVVLARTAQELEPNNLSSLLGIDYPEYVSYTSNVLGEIQHQLLQPAPRSTPSPSPFQGRPRR